MNIFQRLNKVMSEVAYIKKDAAVTGAGGGYKAVTHDQVVSIVRGKFVEHGIVVYPVERESSMPIMRDVKNDVKMHLYSATYDINFVNMDDPNDRAVVTVTAHANDNGDKAPGKCVTYATKSAILKILCLETGENDESREEVREKSKPTLTDDRLDKAIARIKAGEYSVDKLFSSFRLNDAQKAKVLSGGDE